MDDSAFSSLLPTLAAQEPGGSVERHLEAKNRLDGGNRTKPTFLGLAVTQLLPTPTARDSDYFTLAQEAAKLLPTPTTQPTTGNGHARSLGREAKLLPTPSAQAARHGSTPDETAHGYGFNLWDLPSLLPSGEPTETPSGDGSSCSVEPLPGQLTIEGA